MNTYKLNLRELNPEFTKVTGPDMTIENKEDGKVYITCKPYIDKLFKLMGFKSLGVIKILEEYAGRYISDIGDLGDRKLYVDDVTDSFVVTTSQSIEWVNNMIKYLNDHNYEIVEVRRPDPYYYWDQLTIKSPTGSKFALYIDLADEYVQVLSLAYDKSDCTKLIGIINEGNYKFSDGDSSLTSLVTLISNPVDVSYNFKLDQKLSINEYVELLKLLGYVSKKKKNYYKTDESAEIEGYAGNLDSILDDFNSMSWLQRRITEVPNCAKFEDACTLISINLKDITFWKVKDFYYNNASEKSDFFALSY